MSSGKDEKKDRTVRLLLEMQLVDRMNLNDGCVRYETGFHVENHGLKVYGQCRECREK